MRLSPGKWINNNGIISSTKTGFKMTTVKWLEMEDLSVTKLARLREASTVCPLYLRKLERVNMKVGKWWHGLERRDSEVGMGGWMDVSSAALYMYEPLAC